MTWPFAQQILATLTLLDSLGWRQDGDQEFCIEQPLLPSSLDCKRLDDSKVERRLANSPWLDTCMDTFVLDVERAVLLELKVEGAHQRPSPSHSSSPVSCSPWLES